MREEREEGKIGKKVFFFCIYSPALPISYLSLEQNNNDSKSPWQYCLHFKLNIPRTFC